MTKGRLQDTADAVSRVRAEAEYRHGGLEPAGMPCSALRTVGQAPATERLPISDSLTSLLGPEL